MIDSTLSPTAKPVWDAYEELLEYECVVTRTDMKALAAALRAAADCLWVDKSDGANGVYETHRAQLLAIADELETQ